MPIPKTRVVVDKDAGFTKEPIPRTEVKKTVFGGREDYHRQKELKHAKQNRHYGVQQKRFKTKKVVLTRRDKKFQIWKAGGMTQRMKDVVRRTAPKHLTVDGGFYRFRRLETMVRRKHSEELHRQRMVQRRLNPKSWKMVAKDLRGANVILVVRVAATKNLPKPIQRKLRMLGLQGQWLAMLVRYTPNLAKLLNDVLQYVTYGIPTRALINDLVLKKGRIQDPAHRQLRRPKTITSNAVIETALGKYGVICIEDVVDVLATALDGFKKDPFVVLPNEKKIPRWEQFEAVAKMVNPFRLNWRRNTINERVMPFNRGGSWGNRGELIGKFVETLI